MLSDVQWARMAELLPGKPTDKGARAADTGCSWRPCSTPRESETLGVICQGPLATGIPCRCALRGGRPRACGRAWPKPSGARPIWKRYSLTRPQFVPTSTRRALPKKPWRSGDRPVARRADHPDPRGCRCPGPSVAVDPHGRSCRRHHAGARAGGVHRGRSGRRRQGVRQRCLCWDP